MPIPKKPGVLNDPWRKAPVVEKPKVVRKAQPVPEDRDVLTIDQPYMLALQNYGGLCLLGGKTGTDVLLKLLDFCVDHLKRVDDVLANYGVVVAQLDHEPRKLLFYLQREDGWTLAVPEAVSRDNASVQLIQAVLTLQNDSTLKTLLTKYKLSAYRS